MMNLMQYVFTTIKNVIFARKSMCVYTYLSPQQSHSGNSMKQWHIGQNGIKVFLEQCEEQRGLQLSCNSIRSIFLLDLERGSGIYKVWPLKKEASILDIVTYPSPLSKDLLPSLSVPPRIISASKSPPATRPHIICGYLHSKSEEVRKIKAWSFKPSRKKILKGHLALELPMGSAKAVTSHLAICAPPPPALPPLRILLPPVSCHRH